MPKRSPQRRTNKTPSGPASKSRKWLLCGVLIVAGITAAVWGVRAWSLWQVERQIAARDNLSAQGWLELAQALGPETARTAFLEARLNRKLGRIEAFEASVNDAKAAGAQPERLELERLLLAAQTGRIEAIQPVFGTLLVEYNDQAAEICEAYVLSCLLNYRFPEAETVLKTWELDYPQDPQPHYLRGRIREHQNKYDEAEAAYRAALERQPRHAAAAFNLGRLLTVQQKPEAALAAYQQCAEALEYPHAAWVGIGRSHRALGNADEARYWLERAAAEADHPRVQEVYRWLGETSESAGAQAADEMGKLELDAGNFDAAVKWFEQAVEANPRDWKIRHGLATALRQAGDRERAAEEFARVEEFRQAWQRIDRLMDELQENPRSPEVRARIGEAFLTYYSENQGLVWLNSAVNLDPDYPEAHRILADYYEARADEQPGFAQLAAAHRRKAERAGESFEATSEPAATGE